MSPKSRIILFNLGIIDEGFAFFIFLQPWTRSCGGSLLCPLVYGI
jgi:hypothetical protein